MRSLGHAHQLDRPCAGVRAPCELMLSQRGVLQCYSISRAREPTCVQAWEAMGSLEASNTTGILPALPYVPGRPGIPL